LLNYIQVKKTENEWTGVSFQNIMTIMLSTFAQLQKPLAVL